MKTIAIFFLLLTYALVGAGVLIFVDCYRIHEVGVGIAFASMEFLLAGWCTYRGLTLWRG